MLISECHSECHSEFDITLNVLGHDYLIMDTVTGESGRATVSRQSTSQSSHLCQACLSVFERDDLESRPYCYYPHHSNLDNFIEAAQARCCVCSPMFSSLPIDKQESLRLLAAGIEPDGHPVQSLQKTRLETVFESFSPETDANSLRCFLESQVSLAPKDFVSFTRMWFSSPSPRALVIRIGLEPLYETFFPPEMGRYSDSLRKMWMNVADYLSFGESDPLIICRSDP